MQQIYKSIEELPAILTVKDLQRLFCIGQVQAYELARSEGFPAMKIGGSIKTPKHLLVKWIEEGARKGVRRE
jgi:hypothetical protein